MLNRYFRTLVALDFPDFSRMVKCFPESSIKSCLEFVARHYFTHAFEHSASPSTSAESRIRLFFLGIDDLSKCPKHRELMVAISHEMDCGLHLDLPNRVDRSPMVLLPVAANVSAEAVKIDWMLVLGSTRIVLWIPLGPLHGAAQHIARLDPRLAAAGDSVQKALRILCTDLGNHGRMLEMLVAHLRRDGGANLVRLLAEGTDMVPQILLALEDSCEAYLSSLDAAPLSIVAAAILRRQVYRHEKPDGCDVTFGELHMRGTYISSDTPYIQGDMFTPELSPFQLLYWARSIQNGVDSSDLCHKVAEVLSRVMRRDFILTDVPFEHVIGGT